MKKYSFLFPRNAFLAVAVAAGMVWSAVAAAMADDLEGVIGRGELRHLGIPYANFVTGSGDGLDVELMQRFAAHLGVRYRYVETTWADAIGDLTGSRVVRADGRWTKGAHVPVRGDVVANGMTVLDWRKSFVEFGATTFPTQVWLVAHASSSIRPVTPGTTLATDIETTLSLVNSRSVLGKNGTCLDPSLFDIEGHGGRGLPFEGSLNELVPAIINGDADLTLLDVPNALIDLEKWPGQIKVLGPVSQVQNMAPAFREDSPALRDAFNAFFSRLRGSGEWSELVRRYYPFVETYFPDFLQDTRIGLGRSESLP